jgi:hypothetical protein
MRDFYFNISIHICNKHTLFVIEQLLLLNVIFAKVHYFIREDSFVGIWKGSEIVIAVMYSFQNVHKEDKCRGFHTCLHICIREPLDRILM